MLKKRFLNKWSPSEYMESSLEVLDGHVCALQHETPIQYPCCSRERLWVVADLKGRYRNGWMNERMNEWT